MQCHHFIPHSLIDEGREVWSDTDIDDVQDAYDFNVPEPESPSGSQQEAGTESARMSSNVLVQWLLAASPFSSRLIAL